ncbi:MAG: inositol monophosphatase [Saprospiraceae bacterium]|nr:inositol monophosphatase [Saprospiraceae bacterium]
MNEALYNSQELLKNAVEVVYAAGAFIRSNRKKVLQEDIEEKGTNSLVSFVDKTTEKILVEGLRLLIPEAGFITEEDMVTQGKKTWTWVIDPLDGTTNFLHDIPVFSVSVALLFEDNPEIAIVYEVVGDEMFTAINNKGAFLNSLPIRVTSETNTKNVLFGTGFPYEKDNLTNGHLDVLQKVLLHSRGIRRMGSAAVDLCYVACGRFGVFYETDLNSWDVAAGGLIVQEAGGLVSSLYGTQSWLTGENILACAPGLEKETLWLMQDFRKS